MAGSVNWQISFYWKHDLQSPRDREVSLLGPTPMSNLPLNRARVEASLFIAKIVFAHFKFHLPSYAAWSVADWDRAGPEYNEVRDCMLGWDVTDFGSLDFEHIGRTLFTLRNGNLHDLRYPKGYAEKLILDPEGQRAPPHFHRTQREDLIHRGGGNTR